MNATTPKLSAASAFYHGAYLAFLDSLGSGATPTVLPCSEAHHKAAEVLDTLFQRIGLDLPMEGSSDTMQIFGDNKFGLAPFFIDLGLYFTCYEVHHTPGGSGLK